MKNMIMFGVLGLVLFGLVFVIADSDDSGNGAQVQSNSQASVISANSVGNNQGAGIDDALNGGQVRAEAMQRIRERLQEDEELTIGEKLRVRKTIENKIRLRAGDTEAETELELEAEEDNLNQTKLKAILSNGRKAEIKIMPNVASQTALERLRLKVCNESNNCTIQLKEVAQNRVQNQSRLAYEVQAQKHYKLLGLFRLKAQNKVQVDAETGEVTIVKKPWWAFLATEPI